MLQECKKSVAVIGAGASGLTVMKELTQLGHSVVCFEENIRIGGVYCKSYDRTMLTTSRCACRTHADRDRQGASGLVAIDLPVATGP